MYLKGVHPDNTRLSLLTLVDWVWGMHVYNVCAVYPSTQLFKYLWPVTVVTVSTTTVESDCVNTDFLI